MIAFFANIFGYILNFLYEFVGNFGISIILFSIIVKIIMIPISIKQQKTMKKSQKINEEMKQIQFKYKNDAEKMNKEVMELYKRENMSPFSGCFSAIVQLILLFSVFFLVKSPLTYMKKVDSDKIERLEAVVKEEGMSTNYEEISVINYINRYKNGDIEENTENQDESFKISDYIDEVYINMDFFGIDLSKVPSQDIANIKTLIIPILYIISSFVSIRMSTNTTSNKSNKLISDGSNETNQDSTLNSDPMADANKSMSWLMPLMSVSIAYIAPLGLALYWLMNNILMIAERIIFNRIIKDDEEEASQNA